MPAAGLIGEMVDCFRIVDNTECKPIAPLIEPVRALNANPVRMRMILENILPTTMFYSLVHGQVRERGDQSQARRINEEIDCAQNQDRNLDHALGGSVIDVRVWRKNTEIHRSVRDRGGVRLGLPPVRKTVLQMDGSDGR